MDFSQILKTPNDGKTVTYVVGLLFRNEGKEVALIVKDRPEWQKGRLNGIGGHVEQGEGYYEALVREFEEEATAVVTDWRPYCFLSGVDGNWKLMMFTSHQPAKIKTTDKTEPVAWYKVSSLPKRKCVLNLEWLIHMALDPSVREGMITINNFTTDPT